MEAKMSVDEKLNELKSRFSGKVNVKFSGNTIHLFNDVLDKTFYIAKGNHKLPPTWWIGNTGSGSKCVSDEMGLCPYGEEGSCYSLKAEIQYPNCLPRRCENEATFEWVVSNGLIVEFTYGLVLAQKQARNKMNVFRFNESGDIQNNEWLFCMEFVAKQLYDIGVTTMCYTHRFDMMKQFDFIRYLVMNGSDFVIDNEFRVVTEFTGNNLKCCGDCGICEKAYRGGWCTKKLDDMSMEEFEWLYDYVVKKGYDISMLKNGLVIEVLKH